MVYGLNNVTCTFYCYTVQANVCNLGTVYNYNSIIKSDMKKLLTLDKLGDKLPFKFDYDGEKVNVEDAFLLQVSNHHETELDTIKIHYSSTSISDNASRVRISLNSQGHNRLEGNVHPATFPANFCIINALDKININGN